MSLTNESTSELGGRTVGDARLVVRMHDEVLGTSARVGVTTRRDKTQVRTTPVVTPARIVS